MDLQGMAERVSRRRTGAIFGLSALAVLTFFRLREQSASLGFLDFLRLAEGLLPVVGMLLALEAVLLLLGFLPFFRRREAWTGLVAFAHLVFLVFGVMDHRYFLATGTRLNADLVVYALRYAGSMGGILEEGFDLQFIGPILLVLLAVLAAWVASRTSPVRIFGASASVEALLLAVAALILVDRPSRGEIPEALLDHMLSGGEGAASDIQAFGPYERPVLASKAKRPRDVVLVILETFRADAVGAYLGYPESTDTPELDRLAREGVVVENTYATVAHTSKALVGILCGGFPRLNLQIDEAREGGLPLACLPRLLGELGYRTRFAQTADGSFEDRIGLVRNMGFEAWRMREDLDGEVAGYLGMDERALIAPAVEWAKEDDERPLFLTLLTSVSHHPYHVPGDPPVEGQATWEDYRKSVRHVDAAVGEIVAALKKELPDAIFVLVGDHGEGFGEHGIWGHNLLAYEEGIRVPLIFHGADDLLPRGRLGGLRHQVDLLPTLLDLLGVEWEGSLPGLSLLEPKGHQYVVSSCWLRRRCIALRIGDLKFIDHYDLERMEVYDLAADPAEKENLASYYPRAVLRSAEARLRRIQADLESVYLGSQREASTRLADFD